MADRQLLLIKKETVYGTDIVPAAADTIWAENVRYKPLGDRVRGKVAKPGYAQIAGHLVREYAEIEFDIPLVASGTAGTAPKWGPIAKACGESETIVATTSVTYAPQTDTSAADSVSIYWREGRRKHVMLGARGVVTTKLGAGDRPMRHYKLKGLVVDVTTAAALAAADATWTGWVDAKPIIQGRTTFSFAGQTLPFYELNIEHNDRSVFKDLPGQENVQLLGDRIISGNVKAGTPLPSTLNLETLASAGTVSTAALVHNVGLAGNIVTVNLRFQNEKPDYVDEQGEDAFTAQLTGVPSTLATDDEYSIVLT